MDASILDNGLVLPVAAAIAFAIGWLIKGVRARRDFADAQTKAQLKIEQINRHRNAQTAEMDTLRSTVQAQETVIHDRELDASEARTELHKALQKEKLLKRNIYMLRTEREDFKSKMGVFQSRMAMLQQQSIELQAEFVKSRDFYVGELSKSFEKRKIVEEKLESSRQEHESFRSLLDSAKSEHEAVTRMLATAKQQLEKLDGLEQQADSLESENARLKHQVALLQQANDGLKRDVEEVEVLKAQNREMAQVLKSIEDSRRQYEADANRYREHADQQERHSETLRLRLDEVERNFQEIEQQQSKALTNARRIETARSAGKKVASIQEVDDLKQIIGIGKVFEHTLNELGVTSFRQIANFDAADIARVNVALKEFKGRMEQDDWIGQAKELLYKKSGAA